MTLLKMSQIYAQTIGLLTVFTLSLTGCLPNLDEYDSAAPPLRASPETTIRPLEEEVADYPESFEAQAKQTLNLLQRAQQAHYIERRQFAASVDALGIGLEMEDDTYIYAIQPGTLQSLVSISATPKFDPLRSYTAAVTVNVTVDRLETLICQSERPSTSPPIIMGSGERISCSPGAQPLE
ncbi:MAG: type IV pilin-like G/H family protein [Cyanobacteria bacterium J06638_22]